MSAATVALTELGPSRTGVFLNLLPVFTAIIAVALGDALTIWQVIGGLIVLAGVYLTTRPGATIAAPVAGASPAEPVPDAPADDVRVDPPARP